jgi:NADH-ubiquinone oxidoreductase chain 4
LNFFFSRLIPTLFWGWGNRPERVQGLIYLLFYTSLAYLPLLVGILFVDSSFSSLWFFLVRGNDVLVGGLFYVCTGFYLFGYKYRKQTLLPTKLLILTHAKRAIP